MKTILIGLLFLSSATSLATTTSTLCTGSLLIQETKKFGGQSSAATIKWTIEESNSNEIVIKDQYGNTISGTIENETISIYEEKQLSSQIKFQTVQSEEKTKSDSYFLQITIEDYNLTGSLAYISTGLLICTTQE